MFLKRLLISSVEGIIRDISFKMGLNLIVDDTPSGDGLKDTGNNVGKTTVLRLIDYCLGGDAKPIYADLEGSGGVYEKVASFLKDREVRITLELVDDLDAAAPGRVILERNFLKRKAGLRRVNGKEYSSDDKYRDAVCEAVMPALSVREKPTYRQAVAHNMRIDEHRLTHTLEVLHGSAKHIEYEALYLFMLGCPDVDAGEKQKVAEKRRAEWNYLNRLKRGNSEKDYELAINQVDNEIKELEERRAKISADPDFADKLRQSDELAVRISRLQGELSHIEIRIDLINDSVSAIRDERSDLDTGRLRELYQEASSLVPGLQHSFEQLVEFHNAMVDERIRFIGEDLPDLEKRRSQLRKELQAALDRDKELAPFLEGKITSSEFEELLSEINIRHQRKGELQGALEQIRDSLSRIHEYDQRLGEIERAATALSLDKRLDEQLAKFNREFSAVSNRLYGESYFLSYEHKKDKSGAPYRHFRIPDVANVSSGKKQGEMLCFDIAYTRFADQEKIDCLHFLLNDKKELVHGNQLREVARVAEESGVQLVISMLRDKLPSEMADSSNVVLELSARDKLFRIEADC